MTESGVAAADREVSSAPLVELQGITSSFGPTRVLHGIDLAIRHGEVVALLGPSGSGKSTLIRCINGLQPIDDGCVLIDGEPLPREGKALARHRADVGMVFQSFNLFAHKTILQNCTLGLIKVRGLGKDAAKERALKLLDRVGIADKADRYPAELSGGQQQRAAIARALAMEPKVMLFDEPTSALDPEMISEVLDVMIGLAEEGTTMVVVTHEMGFARKAAQRVVFLESGQVVEEAAPEQFFSNPRTERAQSFLSKILSH
jgi:glutamate transport system ATP-binding protein